MNEVFPFLTEIALILGIATLVALLMQSLRLPLILGYLLTGIVVGPAALNLLHSADMVHVFSELGITCLLFIVGLHLSPRVSREVGASALTTGIVQMAIITAIGTAILCAIGYAWTPAIFVGFLLSLNSTIVITKILSDRKDLGKLYGKLTVGILLVQDVVATIVITALPFISHQLTFTSEVLLGLFGKACILGVFIWLMSRVVLPRLTPLFARSQEFLFLLTVTWGMCLAAMFSALGFSREVGALVAGIALASSPYHFEISARIKVLRDFFMILFFILLGSQLSFVGIQQQIPIACALSALLVIGNPLLIGLVLRAQRFPSRLAWLSGLSFTQVSEFSLVLLILASQVGLVGSASVSLVTLVTLITMFVSTVLMQLARPCVRALLAIFPPGKHERHALGKRDKTSYDVILLGCHRLGQDFLATLKKGDDSFLVVDFDPAIIDHLQAQGIACRYGDVEDNEFMDELNFKKTKMVISTLPDVKTNLFIMDKLRKASKQTLFISMAHAVEEALRLYEAGATYVVMPYFIGGNYSSLLIDKYGYDAKKFSQERKHHLVHLHKRRSAGITPSASEEYKHLTSGA